MPTTKVWTMIAVALGAYLAAAATCSVALRGLRKRANLLAVTAAASQGGGKKAVETKKRKGDALSVRLYGPLVRRTAPTRVASSEGGTYPLVFLPTASEAERALAGDIAAGRVTRLIVAGTLVDLVPESRPSVERDGTVAVLVAANTDTTDESGTDRVQPTSIGVGGGTALSTLYHHHDDPAVTSFVIGLP